MGLHHDQKEGDPDGAVHISPSVECFYVDHVGHAHLCCLCVSVYDCLLGIALLLLRLYCWLDLGALGCGILASMRQPDSAAPNI